jgi:hypothetical protein
MRSQDSTVSIAMGCGLDVRGLIPGRGKIFLFSIVFRQALEPAQPPIDWLPELIPLGVEQADNSPPSSSKVKNGGDIPYSPICLHA